MNPYFRCSRCSREIEEEETGFFEVNKRNRFDLVCAGCSMLPFEMV